jgi:hypothetical protein
MCRWMRRRRSSGAGCGLYLSVRIIDECTRRHGISDWLLSPRRERYTFHYKNPIRIWHRFTLTHCMHLPTSSPCRVSATCRHKGILTDIVNLISRPHPVSALFRWTIRQSADIGQRRGHVLYIPWRVLRCRCTPNNASANSCIRALVVLAPASVS